MNREIKFRAWVDNGYIKEMHYTDQIEMNSADAWSLWCLLGFKDTYPEERRLLDWQKEIKWMQFTGLLDKNGKDIYEGDIISDEGINGCIVFQSGCFMIEWISADVYMDPIGFDKHGRSRNYIEIIGNIYENPTLLQRPSSFP